MSLFAVHDEMPESLEISDYDYALPAEAIAQSPLGRRDDSLLLVLEKDTGVIHHSRFTALGDWFSPGDLFVVNNSRVLPARLRGTRLPGGGKIELLLLRKTGDVWNALAKPAKRLAIGTRLEFPSHEPETNSAFAVVEQLLGDGEVRVRFLHAEDERLEAYGEAPLPPYIGEPLADADRYQTIFGRVPGSAAAPTAGLHFSPEMVRGLQNLGVLFAEVTLHVGIDTFRPISVANARDHRIHREWCEVSDQTAQEIAACRQRGGRVVAVGTTSARTLETLGRGWSDARPTGISGMTEEFIVPGHKWMIVDAMITNFHLPRSSLLLLVSALAGRERILQAYAEAVQHGYRFYSFGDAMLIV